VSILNLLSFTTINPFHSPASLHPFIAILSHPKGKKAIPRVWRHFSPRERTIVVTIVVVHLDSLDVVHNALQSPIPAPIKEDIEQFASIVMPALFSRINEEELHVILGLLGLVLDRTDVRSSIRTKIGLVLLTTLVSRAEILKQEDVQAHSSGERQQLWQQYASTYTALFNAVEPMLAHIFPDANPLATDDVYVWQFLAAMGAAANAEQQQRLVIGVKDRVMSAVAGARTLPPGEQERRKGEVNLFMRALGLDVDLLV
jgi:DNA topoisomerase 2-associated protein PAT1